MKQKNKISIRPEISRKIVECVSLCVSENKSRTIELLDGSIVRISPAQASRFIALHDTLNETSQESFRIMLIETKKSFDGINTFCKENI